MAEWKKVVVSGSNISELNNDAGFLASVGSGIVSGSSQISFTGITNVPAGLVSSSAQTIANLPSGTVSGSSQISFTGITNVPAGLVSGSAQITLGGDLSGTANSATVTKVQGVALTSDEATQLANINSTTISSTQWGYLGVMDQNVRTTDAVTFASVNTGQGAYELYAMNQDVETTDAVAFAGLTINGAVAFNNAASAESFNFDPDLSVTTIATASVSQNLTVGGDLIVNGDLTYLNTTNTSVEDQFILLGSGSANNSDIGIIFNDGGGEAGTGVAFFYDGGVDRLSYATAIAHTATAVTPTAYIPLVFDVTGASHTPVTDVGNIKNESAKDYINV